MDSLGPVDDVAAALGCPRVLFRRHQGYARVHSAPLRSIAPARTSAAGFTQRRQWRCFGSIGPAAFSC
jgi:hypothetical protein